MEKSPIQEVFLQTTHMPVEIHAIDKISVWNFQKVPMFMTSQKRSTCCKVFIVKSKQLSYTELEEEIRNQKSLVSNSATNTLHDIFNTFCPLTHLYNATHLDWM